MSNVAQGSDVAHWPLVITMVSVATPGHPKLLYLLNRLSRIYH